MGRRLYVGNLPFSVNEARLKEAFSECGNVRDAKIISDRETGQSRGFGFVEYETDQEAADAITRFAGQDLDGRSLTVNEAHERSGGSRPNGGGFRSNGNGGPPRNNGGGDSSGRGGGRGGRKDFSKRGSRRDEDY